jgi:xanthine dehydrogenase accessory factor
MIRDELSDILSLAEDLKAEELPAVLATLFAASGSTYRSLGSIMLGGPSPAFMAGGVSGGCLEEYIVRRGHPLTDQQQAALLRFVDDPRANRSDVPVLGCGSSIDVLVERFTSEHLSFLHQLAAAHESDQASLVDCLIDTSIPSAIRVRRRLWTDGDPSSHQDPSLATLHQHAMDSQCSIHSSIGKDLQALVQYVRPLVRLVILGAGNDARPLCTLGRSLGWHVSVADRRARLVTRSRFPDADQLVAGDWRSALQSIRFTPSTAVVLMTHSLVDDVAILPLLIERPAAYLGVLGPERRRRWLLENVDKDLPVSFVKRLRGPVGLNLGDPSPGGIAVSIAAEILAELNGRTPAPLSRSNCEKVGTLSTKVSLANVY